MDNILHVYLTCNMFASRLVENSEMGVMLFGAACNKELKAVKILKNSRVTKYLNCSLNFVLFSYLKRLI